MTFTSEPKFGNKPKQKSMYITEVAILDPLNAFC